MNIILPILFFFVIAFSFRSFLNKVTSSRKKSLEQIIDEDHESNFYRIKEIPQSLKIVPNIDFLFLEEFSTYNESISLEERETLNLFKDNIIKKSKNEMFRLNPMLSNIEIKKQFGIANLDSIIIAEEMYYSFIHSLNNYGEILLKYNLNAQAEKVMDFTVNQLKSNILKSYILLIESYSKTGSTDKINIFKETISKIETLQDEIELKEKIILFLESNQF